ncbi:MAG: cytochrome ubiquinol oxidase subunit I [Chlorobi bacterium]|nr:cytochrome ubiquinol oxidase subunit I [Chlorobiota bacterium]
MEQINWELVDWSRAQFALTAMYHWIFVPLTLGLSFMIAIMETIYYKTGDEKWLKIEKFWLKLFGINFAIGVATGIILEFEFGTNWSNYSWFVGDLFGAPLAIEGIMAFFMESTFIAILFFGWNKVSKKAHLISAWLVAIGSNLSALWILVANAWMQNPTGMTFNPDTMRNEMTDFWAVLFNPVAVNKFLHTITSAYTFSALFVIAVSAWLLLKGKNKVYAKYSMLVASIFGFLSVVATIITGDGSAKQVARYQPMKLAAMEGLYEGRTGAPLIAIGVALPDNDTLPKEHIVGVEIPNLLSILAFNDPDRFVPGIKDLVHGNPEYGIPSYEERIQSGKIAIDALAAYKEAKRAGDEKKAMEHLETFRAHYKDFGYGYYYGMDPHMLIPPVALTFYSFHTMVLLGGWFLILFILIFISVMNDTIERKKWLLRAAVLSLPLGLLAQEMGWVTAEVGRQPWVIQDLMPNLVAISHIETAGVKLTFFLFFVTFTALLIAELKIMASTIKKGFPE